MHKIAPLFLILSFAVFGQTPLANLDLFYPGNDLTAVQKKHGPGEVYSPARTGGGVSIYRFSANYGKYKFPVFVQVHQKKILAFWARLPSYLLHDPFHQSLIDRHGAQSKYFKKENTAIYTWKMSDKKMTLVYAGQCALTCFPLYLAGAYDQIPGGGKSLLKKFSRLINARQ